jgi:hypothetical protein
MLSLIESRKVDFSTFILLIFRGLSKNTIKVGMWWDVIGKSKETVLQLFF